MQIAYVCDMETPKTIKASDLQRVGVSKPYAHQLVTGARTPSLSLALRLEAALGIPVKSWPLKGGATA